MKFLVTGFLDSDVSGNRFGYTVSSINGLLEWSMGEMVLVAIVGCEHSYNELCSIFKTKPVYFKYFQQDSSLAEFGAGRLEADLISKALDFWDGSDDEVFIKVTAKYKIENLDQVYEFCRSLNTDFVAWRYPWKNMVDTRFFLFKRCFFIDNRASIFSSFDSSGRYIEHVFFEVSKDLGLATYLVLCRPIISGYSGSAGVEVRFSWLKRTLVKCISSFYLAVKK